MTKIVLTLAAVAISFLSSAVAADYVPKNAFEKEVLSRDLDPAARATLELLFLIRGRVQDPKIFEIRGIPILSAVPWITRDHPTPITINVMIPDREESLQAVRGILRDLKEYGVIEADEAVKKQTYATAEFVYKGYAIYFTRVTLH